MDTDLKVYPWIDPDEGLGTVKTDKQREADNRSRRKRYARKKQQEKNDAVMSRL